MYEEKWTLEDIKLGFEKFYKEHGRLPTAPEVDGSEYLPSSRQIQRRFGGLPKLRKLFGYEHTHFGAGKFRTEISLRSNRSGIEFEHIVEKFLINKFGEPFVHTERRFGDGRNRLDFYVYNSTENFGIDVIYTTSFRDLQKNINIKIPRYIHFGGRLFMVIGGEYDQNKIDLWILNKRKLLPEKCSVLTWELFKICTDSYRPYLDPTNQINSHPGFESK